MMHRLAYHRPFVLPDNMNHFARAVDNLDAAVFSGDGLLDAKNRNLFKRSIERWQRKLLEWEETAADIESETPCE